MRAAEPHPEVQALLEEREARGIPPVHALSVDGAREHLESLYEPPDDPEPVGAVREYTIPGPDEDIPIRIYTPDGDGPFPVLVYFHGGGWVIGTLDTHDATCRALTNAADCVIVSVGYRRAPEHPFPAAVEDCYAATRWVAENLDVVQGNSDSLAVGGDSAGGTLAAAVTQAIRDYGGPELAHQLLVYPPTNHSFSTGSYTQNAEGYALTRADMEWFWDHYLEGRFDGQHPYASPLQARSVAGLPSATVVTCGFDPLRDEGITYADRLAEAGVSVTHRNYDEMVHGFLNLLVEPELQPARDGIADIAGDLRDAFDS
jgi:acetyl esterase